MKAVSSLLEQWRVQVDADQVGTTAAPTLHQCADQLAEAIASDCTRDDFLHGVALVQIGREISGPPSESATASAAVRLLHDVWRAGLAYGVHPAQWTPVVDLAPVILGVLNEARRCEQWPFEAPRQSGCGTR